MGALRAGLRKQARGAAASKVPHGGTLPQAEFISAEEVRERGSPGDGNHRLGQCREAQGS